jgi:hypothetical protein
MPVTVDALRERLSRVQQELFEIEAALGDLVTTTDPADKTAAGDARRTSDADPLAGIEFIDPTEFRKAADRAFAAMGIDLSEPAPSAQEVQEQMLREGVRPGDRLMSRGIIEAREE